MHDECEGRWLVRGLKKGENGWRKEERINKDMGQEEKLAEEIRSSAQMGSEKGRRADKVTGWCCF